MQIFVYVFLLNDAEDEDPFQGKLSKMGRFQQRGSEEIKEGSSQLVTRVIE